MNKVFDFIKAKKYYILALLGVLLISMTMKTQVVTLTYGDEYTVKLEYSLYGYCIRASAPKKSAEPIVQNEIYIGDSVEKSVKKAIVQLEELAGEKQEIGVMSMGYPQKNSKIETKIIELLTKDGYKVNRIDKNN